MSLFMARLSVLNRPLLVRALHVRPRLLVLARPDPDLRWGPGVLQSYESTTREDQEGYGCCVTAGRCH